MVIQAIKVDNENIGWNHLLNRKSGSSAPRHGKEKAPTPPNVTEEVNTFGRPLTAAERETMRDNFGDIRFDKIRKYYPVPENLELPHAHNNIIIDFAAIEPAKPEDVLYQYKLEGYDKDWSPPSNDTRANFGNIFEGTYQFKVKARSPDGVWSEPITYSFKVLPPWFRTWWAYLLYVMSSLAAIYSVFRWRTAKLRQQFEREQYLYQMAERFVPKRVLQLLNRNTSKTFNSAIASKLKFPPYLPTSGALPPSPNP